VKLEEARLCLNCDEVFPESISGACPACARKNNHGLSDWLNRSPVGKRDKKPNIKTLIDQGDNQDGGL